MQLLKLTFPIIIDWFLEQSWKLWNENADQGVAGGQGG